MLPFLSFLSTATSAVVPAASWGLGEEGCVCARHTMVSIVTEAWVLAGCGLASKAATQELPVQQQHRPSAAAAAAGGGKTKKKTVMFRCVSSGGGQDHQREAAAVGRRRGLASCALAAVAVAASLSVRPAWALVLEDDEDIELLERVKEDRKKRLQKQGVISSSGTETGYLQDLIYKLSRVGQAIDRDDLPAASGVLGPSSDAPWVRNINAAFSKFSSSPEERDVADSFNTSLASLFTSVSKLDAESSKSAFVSSATALEKWIALAGLGGQLKGY